MATDISGNKQSKSHKAEGKDKTSAISGERRGYPVPLCKDIKTIAKQLLGKNGLVLAELLTDWQAIIGEELARYIIPFKIKFARGKSTDGILYIQVNGGAFIQYLAYQKPIILEKVNGYFGYQAVSDIKSVQGIFAEKQERKEQVKTLAKSKLDNLAKKADFTPFVQEVLQNIEDKELKLCLQSLAKTYISNDKL